MSYKWKPSKSAAQEFAAKMSEIDDFCKEHGISKSLSSDSYYFQINGQKYRVSNHTIEASNRAAFNDSGEQIRDVYHGSETDDYIQLTASKTRIIDMYNALAAGKLLGKRGRIVNG